MTEKNYEAVYSASLSREMEDDRYIVIDNESGHGQWLGLPLKR